MNAFGSVDAFWYVVAGAAVATGAAIVYWFRRSVRWMLGRVKVAYLAWFAEAVDAHVQPEFDAIRQNTVARAAELKAEADSNAAYLKEQLRSHTEEEGALVRQIVKEENVPILAALAARDEHLARIEARLPQTVQRIEKQ